MHKYVFVLGRKWKLSAAEIFSVFGEEYVDISSEILMKEFKDKISDIQSVQDRLGGTIKICEVFDEVSGFKEVESKIIEYLSDLKNGKLFFAINLFNFTGSIKNILRKLLKNVKNGLKTGEGKVRFLNKPGENVRSVAVFEEKLHEKGTDINIIKSEGKFFLSKTVSVQNFKKYSIRDYERPGRDARSGMLPPKLAQIMINLACGGREKCTIYDPFCGSGTILMEGALIGHQVIGSDISEKAVLDSQKNLEWLKERFDIDISKVKDVFIKDASKIEKKDLKVLPDCIVTETYLGPPIVKFPSEEEIEKNFKEVEGIVFGFLKRLKDLKMNLKIIIAIPYYNIQRSTIFLEKFSKNIKSLGYNLIKLPFCTIRGSSLYERKDQIVGREIFYLELK